MWTIERPLEPLAFSDFHATGESRLFDNARSRRSVLASAIRAQCGNAPTRLSASLKLVMKQSNPEPQQRKNLMMIIKNAQDLFMHLLSETNSAEKQITRALPKMARAADNKKLVEAFEHHLDETHGQLERIQQAADSIPEIRIKRIKSHAMESLIQEGEELIDSTEKGAVRDAGLIDVAQKIEHYEIATYGTLCELTEQLGYNEAKKNLAETLKEEKAADDKLSKIAKQNVNKQAA